jgi:WD40 repeat protein
MSVDAERELNSGNGMLLGIEQVSRLEGHTGNVNSVTWIPSGEKLASASSDNT